MRKSWGTTLDDKLILKLRNFVSDYSLNENQIIECLLTEFFNNKELHKYFITKIRSDRRN